ncbi:MAG: choice-of-anchor D domain-containing protein [Deltaproteobacteria bacterium]|nr:choice-of-anchor D domain-containing protein [Deltaproteobacteria bacterium]
MAASLLPLHSRRVLVVAIGLLPWLGTALLPGCACDDPLAPLPRPAARLSVGDASAPPLDLVVVELPAAPLGVAVPVALTLSNDGERALTVRQVVPGAGPGCDAPDGGFSVTTAPAPASSLRPGEQAAIALTFRATGGRPACTVVTVETDDPVHAALRARITGRGDAPALCTDRVVVDFGQVPIDEARSETVRVTSCGTRAITLASLGEPGAPFSAATTVALPALLAPGDGMDLIAGFTPPEERAYDVRVELATDAPGGPGGSAPRFVVELRGAGVRLPVCHVIAVPDTLHLGTVAAGRRTTAEVLLHDAGLAPCHISGVSMAGASAADTPEPFALVSSEVGAGGTLEPGGTAALTVELAPAEARGTERAVVIVDSDDPTRPRLEIPLEGVSVEPTPCLLEAAPTSVAFGFAAVGSTMERTVALRNVGSEACSVRDLSLASGAPTFAASFDPPPIVGTFLAAGASLDVVVTVHPPAAGPASGTLRARYRALGLSSPEQDLDVPLSASAVSPCVMVTPALVDFGALAVGATASAPVQIASCGAAALTLRGLVLGPGTHSDFSLDPAALAAVPAVLAPGAALDVEVTVTVSADGDGLVRVGALEVLSDDPDDARVSVPLRANASGCAALVCSPASLEFGAVPAGESLERPVACRNLATAPVTLAPALVDVTGAPSAGTFAVVTPAASVAPGDAAVVRVRFTGAAGGGSAGASARLDVGGPTCGSDVEVTAATAAAEPACPTASSFAATELWRWAPVSGRNQVLTTPIVSRLEDTDGDGALTRADAPRVIVASFAAGDLHDAAGPDANAPIPGVLSALDGRTGAVVWSVDDPAWRVLASGTPAVGDLDGDGWPEIVAAAYRELAPVAGSTGGPAMLGRFARGRLLAFSHRGEPLWMSDEWTRRFDELEDAGAPALGDVDGDGTAEVALGDHVFDAHGHLLWRGERAIGSAGRGPLTVFADVDGQPGLELIAGRTVYRGDGSVLWDRADLASWDEDGLPAVGDLDGDGANEVIMRSAALWVLDGRTGESLADSLLPPQGVSSGDTCDPDEMVYPETCYPIPAPIALLDLDGVPGLELVVPNKDVLLAYRFDRDGPFHLVELWRLPAFDTTGAAGVAGFDFFGDGGMDVIYADEQWVSGWAGDGALLYEAPSASVTAMESAAIADVDGDGHAEIIVANNDGPQGGGRGVVALADPGRSWPRARGIWSQHAFIPDLVDELGAPRVASTVGAFRGAAGVCR